MKNRSRLAALTLLALFATVLTDLPRPTAQTFRPVARGRRGVVAGGHPLSVEAGMRMLQRGGNAVDAGVATILAASVIEFSHFSFGGEVPILIKMRGSSRANRGSSPTVRDGVKADGVVVIEGMGTAPAKATREFFANRSKEATASDRPTMPGGFVRSHSVNRTFVRDCACGTGCLRSRAGSVRNEVSGGSDAARHRTRRWVSVG